MCKSNIQLLMFPALAPLAYQSKLRGSGARPFPIYSEEGGPWINVLGETSLTMALVDRCFVNAFYADFNSYYLFMVSFDDVRLTKFFKAVTPTAGNSIYYFLLFLFQRFSNGWRKGKGKGEWRGCCPAACPTRQKAEGEAHPSDTCEILGDFLVLSCALCNCVMDGVRMRLR